MEQAVSHRKKVMIIIVPMIALCHDPLVLVLACRELNMDVGFELTLTILYNHSY